MTPKQIEIKDIDRRRAEYHFIIGHSAAEIFRQLIDNLDNDNRTWIDVLYLEGDYSPLLEFTLLIPNSESKFSYTVAKRLICEGYPHHGS